MKKQTLFNIVLIWLAWSIILIGFMHFVADRVRPDRPDDALMWSATETTIRSNNNKPYLSDPFFNELVAWDSEYYLSISIAGYDNLEMRSQPEESLIQADGEAYHTSYAFFPLYPLMMRVVRIPFTPFLTPIAASTAAGILISLLGTLAGMIALYDIVREDLGEEGGLRAGFMMLIFPTSLFFAVIYTEGLFVGLAFSSLALMRRKQLVIAAILAALATWTRATGGVLIVPLAFSWWMMYSKSENKSVILRQLPVVAFPLIAYGIWRYFNGVPFDFVQTHHFGNGFLAIEKTLRAWGGILVRANEFPETRMIVVLGIGSILLSILSCALMARKYPRLALFGFFALLIPLTGGWTMTQSGIRYVLVVPTLWVLLAYWSKHPVFERAWMLFSILLLAIQAFLFSFDFWVA